MTHAGPRATARTAAHRNRRSPGRAALAFIALAALAIGWPGTGGRAHAAPARHVLTLDAGASGADGHFVPSGEFTYTYALGPHVELGLAIGASRITDTLSYTPYPISFDGNSRYYGPVVAAYVVPTLRLRAGPGGGPVVSFGLGWAGAWGRGLGGDHADAVRIEVGLLERIPLASGIHLALGTQWWLIQGRWRRNEASATGLSLTLGIGVSL